MNTKRIISLVASLALVLSLRAAEPRLPLLYDLVCSYYPLPLCQSRGSAA